MKENFGIKKVVIIPTSHPIKLYSDCCNSKTSIFMTNEEIWTNVFIEQYCKKCKKLVVWRQKRGENNGTNI